MDISMLNNEQYKLYREAENQVSDVEYLTSAEQAKADCIAYAGA